MFDLMTFGEAMLRLSPPGAQVIEQSTALNMYPAGSELNVAVTAQRLGLRVAYVSKFADDPLGRYMTNRAREHGVDVSAVRYGSGKRQGLYFFENGTRPRPGMAYYDRKDSAFSQINAAEFPWDVLLPQTQVFLTSGINPALGSNVHAATMSAVQTAHSLGVKVAFDTNYRSTLWDRDAAAETLLQYLPYVDILLTSEGDAHSILGMAADMRGPDVARTIATQYQVGTVCLIHGSTNPEALWSITCVSAGSVHSVDQVGRLRAVERLGAGDAFAGGFLTGFLESGPELGLRMGNASMTLKNTYLGDLPWFTREMVDSLLAGETDMLRR